MFKSIRTSLIALTLIGALTLVGCAKKEEEAPSAAVLASQDSILQYVPADAPYVIANVEPLPDELLDKLEPKLDEVLQSYNELLQEIAKMAAAESAKEGGDKADAEKINAIVEELSSLMSIEGLRGAGIERDSTAVLYGVGLLPVLRVGVSDGALFDAAMARIETRAGEKMPVATIGASSFRYAEADKAKIIVATFENQVVVTLVPSSFDDAQISEVLGLKLPKANIADSGVLQNIAKEYGYTSHYVGFVDFERIVGTFVGDAGGLDAALLELMENDKPELSAVCKAEIKALAGIAPRMVLGYKEVRADRMSGQAVLELREDIATGLASLPAAVPGLGGDQGGLMSFGMSLDVMAARQFYEARLDALEAAPFECAEFAELQAGIEAGRLALSQPVPPMIYDFRGFLAVIENLEGMDMATNTPPTSVDGRILLAMNNAPALLAMGAMFSPELAGLNVEANGVPVPFESPQMQAVLQAVHLAMTDDALSMSFGEGMERQLGDMLSAKAVSNGTFMSFSMDAGRYYAFIGEAITLAEADEENPLPPQFQAAMNDMMLSLSDFYDRMTTDVRLTKRGIEFDSTVTIKD